MHHRDICRAVEHDERQLNQVELMDLTEELLPCAEIHRRPFLCVELIQSTVTVKRPFESHWLEQFALEQGGIVGVIDKSPRPLRNIIPVQHGSRGRLRLPPGGLALPERAPGDLNQAAAIGVHLIEVGILVRPRQGAMREDDLRPIRRPGRIEIELIARHLHQVRAVGKDRVELRYGAHGEGAVGLEEDARAIRRPPRIPRLQVPPRCQLLQTAAIQVDEE